MPVKWTPDNDQMLLLKILETHDLNVDAKKISAAWPTHGEVPTARAITERLVKIRANARANGAGNFAISSSQSKTSSGKTSTPSKSVATPKSNSRMNTTTPSKTPSVPPTQHNDTFGTPTPAANKRRRTNNIVKEEEDDDGDSTMGRVSAAEAASLGLDASADSIPLASFVTSTANFRSLADPFGDPPTRNGTNGSTQRRTVQGSEPAMKMEGNRHGSDGTGDGGHGLVLDLEDDDENYMRYEV